MGACIHGFAYFHDPAEVKHDDAVTHQLHRIEIMRNEQDGETKTPAQMLQKVEHLRILVAAIL
jgi:hypothetical protein